ncbi:cytochrome P450 [Nocardioides cavernae]|uniref:Cytochrome P450 n=1 Tax=Nocardioides cavernae TaxID=1921566 RepID=A0A7Y9KSL2_9ACTN|nr:cytochrome P450 [Nocardioides cavernae]NYE35923.1 cytochrome P450 [Nocardioides cavernae]
MTRIDSAESAGGRLGAVLSAPRTGVHALGTHGPWLATTPAVAREVLTDPARFDFPSDVSRTGDLSGSTGDTRSGHLVFAPLDPAQVALGRATFVREWADAVRDHDRARPGQPYDALDLLRRPVARATTAAATPALAPAERDAVGDAVLDWIDALGPVIAARRPPGRWSRLRRREARARTHLEDLLASLDAVERPAETATFLAAGIQVPIAAGAFLLAHLASHPTGAVDPVSAVWETLRLTPPTWMTARITREEVALGGTTVPAGSVVMVSPLLLGRLEDLVPGGPAPLGDFEPTRWEGPRRPGAWLPFGAGPHACPGRTLGLAVLTEVATWGVEREMVLSERVRIDQSRGISPRPCRFTATTRTEPSA